MLGAMIKTISPSPIPSLKKAYAKLSIFRNISLYLIRQAIAQHEQSKGTLK